MRRHLKIFAFSLQTSEDASEDTASLEEEPEDDDIDSHVSYGLNKIKQFVMKRYEKLKEEGNLKAYVRKIVSSSLKIEHWTPQRTSRKFSVIFLLFRTKVGSNFSCFNRNIRKIPLPSSITTTDPPTTSAQLHHSLGNVSTKLQSHI